MAASSPDDIARLLNLGVNDSSALGDVIADYYFEGRACDHENDSDDDFLEEQDGMIVNKPQQCNNAIIMCTCNNVALQNWRGTLHSLMMITTASHLSLSSLTTSIPSLVMLREQLPRLQSW